MHRRPTMLLDFNKPSCSTKDFEAKKVLVPMNVVKIDSLKQFRKREVPKLDTMSFNLPLVYLNNVSIYILPVCFQTVKRFDGQCGLCGDPYDGPKEHETGGKYATGES